MRHRKRGRKLNRTASHRKALLRNLAVSLFEHERITTTVAKAKEAAPVAEKMITLAKRGTLAHRRRALSFLQDRWIVKKLFDEIGPRYIDRPGGYTRVLRLSQWRLGDGAQKALLELVGPADEKADKKAEAAPAVEPETSEAQGAAQADEKAEAGDAPTSADQAEDESEDKPDGEAEAKDEEDKKDESS